MQDRWYGLQVLYYRPTLWACLDIDGEAEKLPAEVIAHFRRATSIETIKRKPKVEVVTDTFDDRKRYHRALIQRLQTRTLLPGIVFLDPDTGIQSSSPGPQHVLEEELAELWRALQGRDILAVYQHQTNRNGEPWIEQTRAQLERALHVPSGSVKIARAESIARDVVLFYIQKPAKRSRNEFATGCSAHSDE